MCGIAGIIDVALKPLPNLQRHLGVMNDLQRHRGPDGQGVWNHPKNHVGFGHRRLSIIDLTENARQPMTDAAGNWITFNGEIYNFIELRKELGEDSFRTKSDTEVILHAYRKWGTDCVTHLRGMFAFAIWDEKKATLFCARDRFGIKPFYYLQNGKKLYFASEIKALLPFAKEISTDVDGLKDYLAFQFCMAGKTLFNNINELLPAHHLRVVNGQIEVQRYWEVYYELDFDHTSAYFERRTQELIQDSCNFHVRSDVPVGAYVSGGADSSIVAALASKASDKKFAGFHGKFSIGPEYDESRYAQALADHAGFELHQRDITGTDFIENIRKVIFHLDYPVAGPGSFPQYMVSELASKHRKVVLGGQGGDEIFGGYTRYLIAYFEQCIKAAIDGRGSAGNYIVTYESIIPNLTALKNYKPMLQEFWRDGLFGEMDQRYFRLINRSGVLDKEIRWDALGSYSPFESFQKVFNGNNVHKESYFDKMTHFDFKTLLPALLQVEDRVSMAHGVESRVPFLDHPIVEMAATMPSNIKFKDGTMKQALYNAMKYCLPQAVTERKDKMGFPTPLTVWIQNEAREFVSDIFSCKAAKQREFVDNKLVLSSLNKESKYGRKIWGLLCLELWQQEFHDKEHEYKKLIA